jgi:hypothetical protein
MDEQNKSQDPVLEVGGQEGVNIQVKTSSNISAGPVINDIQAPPEPEVKMEEKDLDAVNTAVDGISDAPVTEEKPVVSPVEEIADSPETQGINQSEDVVEEPEVKEAPETAEAPDQQTEEKSESVPDPFTPAEDVASVPSAPTATTQSMSNNEQSLPHEHRNNKKFAIIITLVTALILAVAAVYVYLSAQNNTSESAKSETMISTQDQVAEPIAASSTDVEQTATQIDDTMKSIDDDTDLNESAISDATLGL